jgi:hypothetical protein
MSKIRFVVIISKSLAGIVQSSFAQASRRGGSTPAVVSAEILPDLQVAFRISAPQLFQ